MRSGGAITVGTFPRASKGQGGAWSPSYTLPDAGDAVFIGENTTESIRLAAYSEANWRYALFGVYGSGCLIEGYSDGGAYVVAGTGGHGAPPNINAVAFDYADATWKLHENANGVSAQSTDYAEGDTNGSPYYELTGTVVPAPGHMYAMSVEIPSALGGGSKSSIALITRGGVTTNGGNISSSAVHRFDLSTDTWSRVTTNQAPFAGFENTAIYDASSGRYYLLIQAFEGRTQLDYLDSSDWTWKSAGSYGWPSGFGSDYSSYAHDPDRGLILLFRGTGMAVLDLSDVASGWQTATVTGTLPNVSGDVWVYHPVNGCFYHVPEAGGTTIYKLVATTDLAWTVSTITLATSLPAYGDGSAVATSPYRTVHYIPSIQMIGRIVGNSTAVGAGQQVSLINPD